MERTYRHFSGSVAEKKSQNSILPGVYEDTDIAEEDVVPPTKGKVYLLNDDTHSFNDVISQVMIAIQCGVKKATKIAETVHATGKCLVKEGNIQECLEVSSVLEEILLKTQIIM